VAYLGKLNINKTRKQVNFDRIPIRFWFTRHTLTVNL